MWTEWRSESRDKDTGPWCLRSRSRGGEGPRSRVPGFRWRSLNVILGPEGTGQARVSKGVQEEEWGPKCSLEGTLRAALVPKGTVLGNSCWEEGLRWEFTKGGVLTGVHPRSSLGVFLGDPSPRADREHPPG